MSLVENSLLSSLPLMVTSVVEEISSHENCVDTSRGYTIKILSDDPCKYKFYSIVDDKII